MANRKNLSDDVTQRDHQSNRKFTETRLLYPRKSVLSILDKGLDRVPLPISEPQTALPLPAHDNVRGPDYYH